MIKIIGKYANVDAITSTTADESVSGAAKSECP
jgi:hypothetical protein